MNYPKPFLIIVTGRPAAGKSTLGSWLSKELNLPVISKDSVREILFDQLGWGDREWARQLGRVSIELMFYFTQAQLACGNSIILDNAFHPDLTAPRVLTLKAQTNAEIIQIICNAKSEILFQRFMERAKGGNRHPGHGDFEVQEELLQHLNREYPLMMSVGGKQIELNTSDFSTLNYSEILRVVKDYMK